MEQEAQNRSARDALLDAAQQLFTEKGYEAVSTRELAESAGVNLGAIQYHFGSKAKLFVDTISRMMEKNGCVRARFGLEGRVASKEEAAARICIFIRGFLSYLLKSQGPQPCRLMFREIMGDASKDPEMNEALISSFVTNFSAPLEEALVDVLRLIIPGSSDAALQRVACSVMGQCSVYASQRPFIERLRNCPLDRAPLFDETAEHIMRFSLSALGCGSDLINRAVALAFEHPVCSGEKK